MKKFYKTLLLCLVVIIATVGLCGCSKSNEDIAYKMITLVAEDYDVDTSDITVVSGTVKKEEDGEGYVGWFKVSVYSSTMYFHVSYYDSKTDKIEYNNATNTVLNSILGKPGPMYLDTKSFNVDKINKMLH